MELAKRRAGNPNLKQTWTQPADKVIRIPEYLSDTLMSLARQIDSGKIKQSELNQMCLDPSGIEAELTAITGKPALSIVPDSSINYIERGETLKEAKERADHYQALYREKLQENEFLSEQLKRSDRREKLEEALNQGLKLIDKFEQLQAESWGTAPNQRGEFKTSSRSWDKYHEFKAWLAKQ